MFAAFAESTDGVLRSGQRLGSEFIFQEMPMGEYRVYLNDFVEQAQSVQIRRGDVVDVCFIPSNGMMGAVRPP